MTKLVRVPKFTDTEAASRRTAFSFLIFIAFFLTLNSQSRANASNLVSGDLPPICYGLSESAQQRFSSRIQAIAEFFEPYDYTKNPITMGIEVELLAPSQFTLKEIAYKAESLAARLYPDSRVWLKEPTVLAEDDWTIVIKNQNNDESEIVITTERGLEVDRKHFGIEIKSPIIRSEMDLHIFLKFLESLAISADLKASPSTAGIHVHVGFDDSSPHELLLLTHFFARIEGQLHRDFGVHKDRLEATKPTSPHLHAMFQSADLGQLDMNDILAFPETHGGELMSFRGRGLNIYSLLKRPTAELRIFNSTLNIKHIFFYALFGSKFIQAFRKKDPKLFDLFMTYPETAVPIELILPIIGIEVSEYRSIVMEHRSTQPRGNSWLDWLFFERLGTLRD